MGKSSVRSISRQFAIAVLTMVVSACSSPEPKPAASAPDTTHPSTTTTFETTTTSLPVRSDAVGLFRVDPATLSPIPGAEPITTDDWISGSVSNNGEWLVLNVWIDTEPDTDGVRVVEASTGRVVTDFSGPLMHELRVGDDGAVYHHPGSCGASLGRLAPGETSFETVFDAFPKAFCPWTPMTLLDGQRVGWVGTFETEPGRQETALLIGDLMTGSASVVELPSVTLWSEGEVVDDLAVDEVFEPAVVWDAERGRALVVHADEAAVSVVDLSSGAVTEHVLSDRTSWIDGIFAWLVPAANAKGPSSGITKSAVLSPSGGLLYVGTQVSELVETADTGWSVESVPQGVEVVDTTSWRVVAQLEIPASQVSISPDGRYVVATGVATYDTSSTTSYHPEGAFVVNVDTLEVVGPIPTPGEWHPNVQYSADGSYVYLGRSGGGPITIVDLKTGEETATIVDGEQLTVFGEVAMLSTRP